MINGTPALLLVPENLNGRLVIYHHGLGETYLSLTAAAEKSSTIRELTQHGYLVASSSAHGDLYGSQPALDDYVALYEYVTANYPITKVLHLSQSMGGLTGLNCIARGLIPADAWAGIYPVCSLLNAYANGTGFGPGIAAVYGIQPGGGNYSAVTAGYDPCTNPASVFAGLPMRMWASSGDTAVPKSEHSDLLQTLVAGVAAESTVIACSGNHGDPSHFRPYDLISFFDRACS